MNGWSSYFITERKIMQRILSDVSKQTNAISKKKRTKKKMKFNQRKINKLLSAVKIYSYTQFNAHIMQ